MMQFIKKSIVIAVIAFAFLVTLGQFGLRSGQNTSSVNPAPRVIVVTPTPTSAPDYFRESFMKGCLESGVATNAFCSCAYNYVSKAMSKDELIGMGIRATDKTLTQEDTDLINQAAESCRILHRN